MYLGVIRVALSQGAINQVWSPTFDEHMAGSAV